MSNEIALPNLKLDKIIEQYNKEKSERNVELEIVYKNNKKINEKTLKKIHSYFNKKNKTFEKSYILDISLLTEKNKRLSRTDTNDILKDHCEFEKANIKNTQNEKYEFPKNYILEEKEFISNIQLDSIDSKINLKTENTIEDSIQKNLFMSSYSLINKTYRYKKRNTYKFDDYKIDITLVKMGKEEQNIFLANLDEQIEHIELEIEYTSKNNLTIDVLKEMIKNMTICNQIINEGYFNINNTESSKIINKYRKILNNESNLSNYNKIGPKPVSLTKNTIIHMLEKTGNESIENKKNLSIDETYKITEKADGERYYMFIDDESKIFLINGNNNVIITGLQLKTTTFTNSILDGELIINKKKYEYKYFDIYIKNNNNEYNKTLEQRIKLMTILNNEINKEDSELNEESCVAYINENKYIKCSIKEYKDISNFDNLRTITDYKIDGVIFMYNDGLSHIKNIKDLSILKYKPLEQNSIDVLLLDKILYCSFIIHNEKKKIKIPIKSEIVCSKPYIVDLCKKKIMKKDESEEVDYDLLNNKIIEIVYYPSPKDYFVLEKIRYDKTLEYIKKNSIAGLANDFNVVNDIIGHSCNPIEEEFINNLNVTNLKNLKNYINRPNSYYEDEDGSRTQIISEKQLKNINNKIKRKLITQAVTILNNNEEKNIKVLEIACGRGGEIPKYISTNFDDDKIYSDKLNNNGIKFILGIDIDSKNIEHIGSNRKDNRARGRFIGMKNDYMKNNPNINEIPNLYKNNSAYFITGDLNKYTGGNDLKTSYNEITTDLQHYFTDELEEDNNLDFPERTNYDFKMLEDINKINNINLFEKEQFELLSCQFAIHYLNLENFCKYINLQLKPGGIFICTFMEKTKVLNLLGDNDEIEGKFWGLRKNSEDSENNIDVKFKTTNNKYMTEKFMTLSSLENELGKYNIKLYKSDVEAVYSNSSSIENVINFGDLSELKNNTDNEFDFNKLYTGVIFQKSELNKKKLDKTSKLIKIST